MPLGVAIEPEACLVDGAGFADAGENILQAAAAWIMVEHVTGREEWNARGFGKGGKTMKPFRVVAMKGIGGGEIDAVFEMRRQILQMPPEAFSFCRCLEHIVRRHNRNDLPLRKRQEIFEPEMTFAFGISWFFAGPLTLALSPRGEGAGSPVATASLSPCGRRTG